MERRLPFIAAIVSGLIVWLATRLFFEEYLGLMTVVILLSLLLVRLEPWAFLGAFVFGVAVELHDKGTNSQLNIALFLLFAGSLANIAFKLTQAPSQRGLLRATARLNMVCALVGIAACRVAQFATCPPSMSVDLNTNLIGAWLEVINCHTRPALDILSSGSLGTGPTATQWNAVAVVFLRGIALSPGLWAAIFAASAQVIVIGKPGRIARQTIRGLFGIVAAGFVLWLGFALLLVVAVFVYMALVLGGTLDTSIENRILQQQDILRALVVFLSIDAFATAVGAGWGAARGLD